MIIREKQKKRREREINRGREGRLGVRQTETDRERTGEQKEKETKRAEGGG